MRLQTHTMELLLIWCKDPVIRLDGKSIYFLRARQIMNNRQIISLVAALAVSLAIPVAAQAQEVLLKVHHFLPSTSYVHMQIIEPWCAKLARESKDRIKCQINPSMQRGGSPGQLIDQARDGIADVVFLNMAYQAGPFLETEAFALPFLMRNQVAGSRAMWDYVQQNALDEFRGTRPILTFLGDHVVLHFATGVAHGTGRRTGAL
jgi:hypothetical protein